MASWHAKMSIEGNLAENHDSILHDSSICFLPREVAESWSWLFRAVLSATLLAAVEGGWTHPGAMSFQALCDGGGEEQRVGNVLIPGVLCAV